MVASLIMLHVYDKIPNESIAFVKEKLKKLDKVGLAKIAIGLPGVKLHDVNMVFWVGSVILGIFGIGRFMLGDRLIGVLKVILLLFSYLLLALSYLALLIPDSYTIAVILMIFGFIGLIGATIWWGIDILLISTRTKRHNLNKLLLLFQV